MLGAVTTVPGIISYVDGIGMYRVNIPFYYAMNFMQGQGLAKSRSHAHV